MSCKAEYQVLDILNAICLETEGHEGAHRVIWKGETIHWNGPAEPIGPSAETIEAAKRYAAELIEKMEAELDRCSRCGVHKSTHRDDSRAAFCPGRFSRADKASGVKVGDKVTSHRWPAESQPGWTKATVVALSGDEAKVEFDAGGPLQWWMVRDLTVVTEEVAR